jgi:hypothetical protein
MRRKDSTETRICWGWGLSARVIELSLHRQGYSSKELESRLGRMDRLHTKSKRDLTLARTRFAGEVGRLERFPALLSLCFPQNPRKVLATFRRQIFKTSDLRMRERACARALRRLRPVFPHPCFILSYWFTGSPANQAGDFGLAAETGKKTIAGALCGLRPAFSATEGVSSFAEERRVKKES